MPKQRGALQLEGSMGDFTYYKSKHGYLIKQKTVIPGERQAVDPAYQRTRENNQEFGIASKASKLVRDTCRELPMSMTNDRLRARLMKAVIGIIRRDTVNPSGRRRVLDEHAVLLEGFEFNPDATIRTILQAPFDTEADRHTGQVSIKVPSFNTRTMLVKPKGATHFRLVMVAAMLDFPNNQHHTVITSSGYLSCRGETAPQQLTVSLPADHLYPIIVVLSVEFYQETNSVQYMLGDGAYHALGIVKVLAG